MNISIFFLTRGQLTADALHNLFSSTSSPTPSIPSLSHS
ncbi:unnamed protein product [Chondrus crispus]|uniref:Uncharacterized protein n=1 Tax=Chondrus crispus TaxID=2769 RepID=R7QPG6_CHOCR|nr:unnamed protein product [Chondrus crispus]CDF39381.1 unnamed protein product [Chondrus crispus]|eukprot:XP_005719292.1 unnamed protein product [Chondrus crispus]